MKIKELMLALSKYDGEEEVQIMVASDEKAYENFKIKDIEEINVKSDNSKFIAIFT